MGAVNTSRKRHNIVENERVDKFLLRLIPSKNKGKCKSIIKRWNLKDRKYH